MGGVGDTLPRPVTVKLKQGDFQFRVKPGLLRVAAAYGELPNLELVNETGLSVEFIFPRGLMTYAAGGGSATNVAIAAGAPSVLVNVNQAFEPKTTEYQVHVMLGPFSIEAAGGSRPEVEIKP
jgi:hypothetical protein